MLGFSRLELAEIRAHFPILKRKIYLSSGSQGALSDAVEAGMREYLESWHEHGTPWDRWVVKCEELRAEFARFIGAEADEVAIVSCASDALNSVASAFDWLVRPRVVMGELEFPTMGHVWLAQERRGARVTFLPADGDSLPVEAYDREVDEETAIVPVTRVCFANGFRSDVHRIAAIARRRGALVLLDDFQDAGTRPIDVKALGVDLYVTGTLKYLLGPSGIAFLYVRKPLIEQLTPASSGWFAQANPFTFDPKRYEPSPTARRFQSGTPPVPNAYAALAGLRLLTGVGLARIAAHIADLTQLVLTRARELGFAVKTPEDSVGPLVVFRSHDAERLVSLLAEDNIVTSSRRDGLRASFHLYNTELDAARLLDGLSRHRDLVVRA